MALNTQLKHVLYVEDDAALARLLQKRMQRHGFDIEVAETAEAGLDMLSARAFQLVLLDYNLPGMSGLEMLARLREQADAPPVIILTAGGDERIALEALENGAADYAVKDVNQTYLDLLPSVMQAAYVKEKLVRENARQRQELQIAVERAEAASRAKSDFLATISHEIRTPLNVVTGLSNVLAKSPLNDEQHRIVETLNTNAKLLLRLINDLLDISRIEEGHIVLEVTPFRPQDLLSEVRVMFAPDMERKGLRFNVETKGEDVTVIGDRTRLQQVLMNLVSNSLKFTETGSVDVCCTTETQNGKAHLSFEVRDTGIGIAPERLSQIFDKFTQADASITRRFGGSGLGLSIVQALVNLMDGKVTVESQQFKETLFRVSLDMPLAAQSESLKPVSDPPADTPSGERARVLIVEDYAPNVMVAEMLLNELGYDCDVNFSGEEAVARIENSTTPYYAILMDVNLDDMDGFEATRRIRQIESGRGYTQPIIGVTAHVLAGDRERCLSAGMDDYLPKPIQPELLKHKLATCARARVDG